ncbi:tRNA lysidine(34) synthetase TilS [[Pasteurella] aerogenes]|nr:tRNA lysidine(34) synthetase TilS [[Pasteurella] aerogenes]
MDIFAKFEHIVSQHQPTQTHFLVGFSGGLDSTALLSLLTKFCQKRPHFSLSAIHIHHGLSPNADHWVTHCQHLCRQLSVPLIVEKVQVDRRLGVEAGAREARYQAIRRYMRADHILTTAHHQQDQTETFFLALKRGSGVQGLSAMPMQSAVFSVPIFRPLLQFTRAELEEYVNSENLPWIEDESNQDNRYDRNFLRHQILPPLRQRWAHFDQAVQRSAQHCLEQQQLLNELLAQELQKYQKNDRTFDISQFAHFSIPKQKALLRLWLANCDLPMPSSKQLAQIIQDVIFAQADRYPEFKLGDKLIRRYRRHLHITPIYQDISHLVLPICLNQSIDLPDNLGKFIIKTQPNEWIAKWQDHRVLLPPTQKPIHLAFRYSGTVLHHGIHQDIKKLWQQHNVPYWLRQRTPLIFYGDQLQCAMGAFRIQQ